MSDGHVMTIDDPELASTATEIAAAVARNGWAVCETFMAPSLIQALMTDASGAAEARQLQPAAIGRGATRARRARVRGDEIAWLDAAACTVAVGEFFARMEQLRHAVNREMLLGLFEFEAHFARYAPGARYARHRDQHRDSGLRQLTVSLYLNEVWPAAAGGALRLYFEDGTTRDILPRAGILVAFLSARFEHEVLPADRERWSITGWFRRRP